VAYYFFLSYWQYCIMAELTQSQIILANKVAQRIKDLRVKNCGPVQMDFVKKYNIEKQLISRWESPIKIDSLSGQRRGRGVSLYTIETFCEAIGITLKEFFDDSLFEK